MELMTISAVRSWLSSSARETAVPPKRPASSRPPTQGAVGDDEPGDALAFQMFHGQLGHFAGTDEEAGFVGQGAEDLAGELDRGITDADGQAADAGFGADFFGHGKGLVQQAVQERSGGLLQGALSVSRLDLPQNLGLAHDHGVQAAGYLKEMVDGLGLPVLVQGG